jgi:CspA family cold shock protein
MANGPDETALGPRPRRATWSRPDISPAAVVLPLASHSDAANIPCGRGGPLWHTSKKAFYVMRISGTVKFFNSAKGFGFITPDEGGKDVFVHATAVEAAGMRALNEGDRVSFELEDDRKGRGKQAGQLKPA